MTSCIARWGLRAEQVRRGRYALMLDPATPLGDDERALLQRHNQEVYDRFVARVADGRKLLRGRVREIARGRIWAGTDALANGLVDELGDLETGIARAKEMAGLGEGARRCGRSTRRTSRCCRRRRMRRSILAMAAPILREKSWTILPGWLEVW